MNNLKEQRFAVKFCVKLGKSTTETFAMLNTAYGDVAMQGMVWNGKENGMEWNGSFGMEYGRCQNGMEWKISRME